MRKLEQRLRIATDETGSVFTGDPADDFLKPAEPTCSSCRFWHEQPRPRIATATGPAVDLDGPAVGQCRESMRSAPTPVGGGIAMMPYYQKTEGTFPACGKYQERDQ